MEIEIKEDQQVDINEVLDRVEFNGHADSEIKAVEPTGLNLTGSSLREIESLILNELKTELDIINEEYSPGSLYSFSFEHFEITAGMYGKLRKGVLADRIKRLVLDNLPAFVGGTRRIVLTLQLTKHDSEGARVQSGFYIHIGLHESTRLSISEVSGKRLLKAAMYQFSTYPNKYPTFGYALASLMRLAAAKKASFLWEGNSRWRLTPSCFWTEAFSVFHLMDYAEALTFFTSICSESEYYELIAQQLRRTGAYSLYEIQDDPEDTLLATKRSFASVTSVFEEQVLLTESAKASGGRFMDCVSALSSHADKKKAYVTLNIGDSKVVGTVDRVQKSPEGIIMSVLHGRTLYLYTGPDLGSALTQESAMPEYLGVKVGTTAHLKKALIKLKPIE